VNLVTGKAPSATQGDDMAMVRARRAFLSRRYYQPLAAALAEVASAAEPHVIADFGCGEGYYLGELMGGPQLSGVAAYGTDISKPAIAAAAKAYPAAQFAVADTNRLIPLAGAVVDVGICVFAPRNPAEFARVIAPGGRLLVAIPAQAHLADLRERFGLLGIERDKATKITAQLGGFTLASTRNVSHTARLDGAALRDLIAMTPNARHMDAGTSAQLADVRVTNAEFEFEILEFIRYTKGNEIS
jgi:23S rRNA (guanine745-N1)-methyltransferase